LRLVLLKPLAVTPSSSSAGPLNDLVVMAGSPEPARLLGS
jgi:hypothetical protein